jgi:uncharacterized RDD family membrane protein YckC
MPRKARKATSPGPVSFADAPTPSAPSLAELPSAGALRRLAALVYDLLVIIAIQFLVTALYLAIVLRGNAPEHAPLLQATLFPLLVVATFGFYAWFWTHGGQTLGMRAWKLKVVDARLAGHRITVTQCLLRFFTGLVSAGTCYLVIYADPSRDALHDRMSGTRTLVIPKSMM